MEESQGMDLKRLEEIGPLLAQIRGVRRQTRYLRLGFGVLIFLTVVGWLWAIVSHFQRMEIDQLGDAFYKRAEKTWPIIADELGKLVDGVLPTVEASLTKELEQAAPEVAKRFEQEASQLDQSLKASIEASMKRRLVAENRAEAIRIIRAVFPEYGDEKKADELAAALQESFLKYAQKRLLTMLAEYYDTLQEFQKTFQQIRASAPEGQKAATLEAVLELWLEVVYEKMGGDSELEAAPVEKKAKTKGRK